MRYETMTRWSVAWAGRWRSHALVMFRVVVTATLRVQISPAFPDGMTKQALTLYSSSPIYHWLIYSTTTMPQQTIVVLNGTARTFKHLIPQALAKGHRVRAVVRSAPRFLSQTKKHDDLSVYEWSDFLDLTTLATILDGADVVYLAYVARGTGMSASP